MFLPVSTTLRSAFIAISQTDVCVRDCFPEYVEGKVGTFLIPRIVPHSLQTCAAASVDISSLLIRVACAQSLGNSILESLKRH